MRQDGGVLNTEDPRGALADAERAVAEAERLAALLHGHRAQVDAARHAVAAARSELGKEAADVERLERVSFARVWADLRGDTGERLARERAEQQAALYRLDAATEGLRAAEEQAGLVEQRHAALGDVSGQQEQARRAVEEWVLRHGGVDAETLTSILHRVAQLEAEQREVAEARAAAEAARPPLASAARVLKEASGWATYDTFFDSGILTDLAKRDRMEAAAQELKVADRALRFLSAELGHIGQRASFDLDFRDGLSAFDLWFDDIFSSWAVRGRIQDAQERVAAAQHLVDSIDQRLETQASDVARELDRAEAERLAILRG